MEKFDPHNLQDNNPPIMPSGHGPKLIIEQEMPKIKAKLDELDKKITACSDPDELVLLQTQKQALLDYMLTPQDTTIYD